MPKKILLILMFFFSVGVKSPPPLVSTASKPSLSKSMSMDVVGQPLMEDEYIEMESACANVEAKTEHTHPGAGHGMYIHVEQNVCMYSSIYAHI